MNCKNTGCNAPESECSGECVTKAAESFEQMALRVFAESRIAEFSEYKSVIWSFSKEDVKKCANALRSELAKQAGSVEPVAWMAPSKERLEFSRPDTVYGSHTLPLYPATALAAQAAKIAELQQSLAWTTAQYEKSEELLNKKIAELQDELAKLKPDAERYRWLRANCVAGHMESRGPKPDLSMNCDEPEKEWDAAIDAARNVK